MTLVPLGSWDDDGYPTDESLEAIGKWDGDEREFFAALKPLWKYSDMPHQDAWCGWHEENGAGIMDEPVRRYNLSTGGWSGNESLVGAMERNIELWATTWVQTRRGGHYIFEVKMR